MTLIFKCFNLVTNYISRQTNTLEMVFWHSSNGHGQNLKRMYLSFLSTFKNIPRTYLKQSAYILNLMPAKIFYVSTKNHFFSELSQKLKLNFWARLKRLPSHLFFIMLVFHLKSAHFVIYKRTYQYEISKMKN